MQAAISQTEKPLNLNTECLYAREGRRGIDRVRDGVELGLEREVDTIKNIQSTMMKTLDQVVQ